MLRVLAVLLGIILAWLPPGARPMTLPTIGVTIDGGTVTSQLLSASWNLGITDFLADLSPNTASLQFKGQLSVSPADAVVITAGGTAMWTGRLDTYTEVRDVNGDYWSSVTATDLIGALGAAQLNAFTFTVFGGETLETLAEDAAADAGVTLSVVDSCSRGLIPIADATTDYRPYTGDLLTYINELAKSSNVMLAAQHDGTLRAWSRQSLDSPDVSNGTFDTNTTGWAATGTGASITRVTASPHTGAGNARIVSGSSLYGGADSSITGTFRAGHTYRLTFWGRTISGSADMIAGLGAQAASDFNNVQKTLTSSWAEYTVDWTATADRTTVSAIFRNTAAVTNTFEIDDVAVSEVINATDISASVVTWEKTTTVDSAVNQWRSKGAVWVDAAASQALYGARNFSALEFGVTTGGAGDDGSFAPFQTWVDNLGAVRPVVTNGELVVKESTDPLLALDPLDWVNDGTDDWQIMSMSWSAAPGEAWRLTITADNLVNLL